MSENYFDIWGNQAPNSADKRCKMEDNSEAAYG